MKTQRILIFYYIAVFLSFFYFKYISLLKNERNPINLKRVNLLKGLETRPFENKIYVYHDNYHLSKKVSIKLNQFISVNGIPSSLSHVESYSSDYQADDFTHSTLEEITDLEKPFIVIVNSSDIETAPSQDQVGNRGSAAKGLDFNLTIKGGNTLIFTLLKNYVYTEQGCERMFALIKRIFLISDYRRLRPTVDVNFVLLSTQGRVYWDFKAMLDDYLNNLVACLSLFHDVNLHSRVASDADLFSKLSTTTSFVKVECDSIEAVVDDGKAPSVLQTADESDTSDRNSNEGNANVDNEGGDDTKGADGNDTNDTDTDTDDDDDTKDTVDSKNDSTADGLTEGNNGDGSEGANERDTESGHSPNGVNSGSESDTTASEGNSSETNANDSDPDEASSDEDNTDTSSSEEGNSSETNANDSDPDEASSDEDNTDTSSSKEGNSDSTNPDESNHTTTDHNSTDHNSTDHNSTDHNTTDHNSTDHNSTDHNSTDSNSTNSGQVKSDAASLDDFDIVEGNTDTDNDNTTDPNTTSHNTTNSDTASSSKHNSDTTNPETKPVEATNLSKDNSDTANSSKHNSDTTDSNNTNDNTKDASETDDCVKGRLHSDLNRSKPAKVTTKRIIKEVEHVTVELNTEFYNFFESLGNVDVAIKDNHYYRNALNFYLVLTDKPTFIKDPMTEERRQSFTIENLGVFLFTSLEELRAGSEGTCSRDGKGSGGEGEEDTHVLNDSEIAQVLSSWVTHVRHLYDLPATKSEFVLSLANPDENMRAESDKYVLSSKSDIELKFGVQFQDPVGMAFYGFEVHKMAKSLVSAYARATFENLAKLAALTKVSYNTQVPKSTAQHANNSMDALEYLMGTKELDDAYFNQMDMNQTLLLVAKYAFLESLEALSDDQMFNKNVLSYEHQLAVFMCDVFPFAFPVLVYMLKLLAERMKNR